MNLGALSICVALCLGLTVGHVQLTVYRGTLVHSRVIEQIEILQDHLLGIDEDNLGEILFVAPSSQLQALAQQHGFDQNDVITLPANQFLMPGLVDCHIHAEQIMNAGANYDKSFFQWLLEDFDPTSQQFAMNLTYARNAASLMVRWTLQHGTTTAAYTAPQGVESDMELVRVIAEQNQRALVGRTTFVAPGFADDSVEQALNRTQSFVQFILDLEDPLIQPMLTPGVLENDPLVEGYGRLTMELNLRVQTHAAEGLPISDGGNLTILQDWEQAGLLPSNRMLGAHGMDLRDNELEFFSQRNLSIGHCPSSNLNLKTGILDVRKVLNLGVTVGLGTDISAGYSPSIFNAMRVAIHTSKSLSLTVNQTNYQPLTHHEAFFMATLGGAQALGMDDTIGNFEVGKQFDALLIDTQAPDASNPVFYTFQQDSMADIIEKFIYLGDDRNILKVYVAGREVFPEPRPPRPGQVVSLINDSPRVEGNNITVDLQTDHPVRCSIRLATMTSPLRDCSSTSFSFTNLAPDDNTPYVMRVVVNHNAVASVRTTIRRQIWIPANSAICTVHLINDGVTVKGNMATVEFASASPATSFQCNLDRQGFSPCGSPHIFRGLSPGSHSVKIRPSNCGRNRRPVSASFVVLS